MQKKKVFFVGIFSNLSIFRVAYFSNLSIFHVAILVI